MIFRILEDQLGQKYRESNEADRRFMQLALTLGRRGLGRTWPNPAVGAVVVKDGLIVGRGWTQPGGRPHAETVALAEGVGLDPGLFFQAIAGGTLDLPYLRIKSKAITERDFTPAFRLALAAKDADLIQQVAAENGLDLPLLAAIARRFAEAAKEHGDKDFSATYLLSAPQRD